MATKTATTPEATTPPPALGEIIERARVLARQRELLGEMVNALNKGLEKLKADALPEIRVAIDAAGAAWAELEALINAHPELFRKPKSLEAHGIVFGYRKGTGGLVIANAEQTMKLIRKHLPEKADVLIATKEAPAKQAIANLTAPELKKIAVELKDTGDTVFIKPAEGALDKLVAALVSAAVDDSQTDDVVG